MSDHLEKAKGALDHAREITEGVDCAPDPTNPQVLRLLDIAAVQASLAQAEAMESIAASLEKMANPNQFVVTTPYVPPANFTPCPPVWSRPLNNTVPPGTDGVIS